MPGLNVVQIQNQTCTSCGIFPPAKGGGLRYYIIAVVSVQRALWKMLFTARKNYRDLHFS